MFNRHPDRTPQSPAWRDEACLCNGVSVTRRRIPPSRGGMSRLLLERHRTVHPRIEDESGWLRSVSRPGPFASADAAAASPAAGAGTSPCRRSIPTWWPHTSGSACSAAPRVGAMRRGVCALWHTVRIRRRREWVWAGVGEGLGRPRMAAPARWRLPRSGVSWDPFPLNPATRRTQEPCDVPPSVPVGCWASPAVVAPPEVNPTPTPTTNSKPPL